MHLIVLLPQEGKGEIEYFGLFAHPEAARRALEEAGWIHRPDLDRWDNGTCLAVIRPMHPSESLGGCRET